MSANRPEERSGAILPLFTFHSPLEMIADDQRGVSSWDLLKGSFFFGLRRRNLRYPMGLLALGLAKTVCVWLVLFFFFFSISLFLADLLGPFFPRLRFGDG